MFGTIVNQNMDIRQREIFLRISLVEVFIINTNPYFAVLFGDRNNIGQPGWILRYLYQTRLYLLRDIFLNLQTQFRFELSSLFLHLFETRVVR